MIKVKENLVGQKFGHLTVIKQVEDWIGSTGTKRANWLCQCDCKDKTLVNANTHNLKTNHKISCGCVKENNLVGMTFNKLFVLGKAEIKNETQYWNCKCSCGNFTKASTTGLKKGYKKSCGCLRNENLIKRYEEKGIKENKYNLTGEYGIGWTSNTNKEFYFDLEDYDKIKNHTWSEGRLGEGSGYARATIKGKQVMMHNFIMRCKLVDHKNRNKLDNQKSNLRKATSQQNSFNGSVRKNSSSGILGVSWDKRLEKWRAYITLNGKQIYLGCYINKEDAIKARLDGERKYFGEFSSQN